MYIEKELENITEDLASKSRLKKILKAYFKDIKREEGESLERIYKKSWKCLVLVLNKKQKKDLRQMETLFCKNMCYGIGFTIKKGIYAGFE